jgi:hypothetical protein
MTMYDAFRFGHRNQQHEQTTTEESISDMVNGLRISSSSNQQGQQANYIMVGTPPPTLAPPPAAPRKRKADTAMKKERSVAAVSAARQLIFEDVAPLDVING